MVVRREFSGYNTHDPCCRTTCMRKALVFVLAVSFGLVLFAAACDSSRDERDLLTSYPEACR